MAGFDSPHGNNIELINIIHLTEKPMIYCNTIGDAVRRYEEDVSIVECELYYTSNERAKNPYSSEYLHAVDIDINELPESIDCDITVFDEDGYNETVECNSDITRNFEGEYGSADAKVMIVIISQIDAMALANLRKINLY